MSTHVKGFIEVNQSDEWHSFVIIHNMPNRQDYRAFAFLFGIRNTMGYQPLAANRGLPTNASQMAKDILLSEYLHSPSWITWREISQSGWQNQNFGAYWWFLMDTMEFISQEYHDDNVRLVVAFG